MIHLLDTISIAGELGKALSIVLKEENVLVLENEFIVRD